MLTFRNWAVSRLPRVLELGPAMRRKERGRRQVERNVKPNSFLAVMLLN